MPVVEEAETSRRDIGRDRRAVDGLGRERLVLRRRLRGAVLRQIGADLVERAGRDLGAVAQPRHQLAVVDDEAAEGGFGRMGRAAIVPDLAQDLVGGSGSALALAFLDPHGCSPRGFIRWLEIKGHSLGGVNHKSSGQNTWAYAHKPN